MDGWMTVLFLPFLLLCLLTFIYLLSAFISSPFPVLIFIPGWFGGNNTLGVRSIHDDLFARALYFSILFFWSFPPHFHLDYSWEKSKSIYLSVFNYQLIQIFLFDCLFI